MAGKRVLVAGYGDVKGTVASFSGAGAIVGSEIDPICALQASMDGYEVKNKTAIGKSDIIVTATGNKDIKRRTF